jgi:hypothetical protein
MKVLSEPTSATETRWDLAEHLTSALKECFTHQAEWHTVEEMTFEQASDLLDYLENQSVTERQLSIQDNGLLTVRWFS